jgi:hypothetical protein
MYILVKYNLLEKYCVKKDGSENYVMKRFVRKIVVEMVDAIIQLVNVIEDLRAKHAIL